MSRRLGLTLLALLAACAAPTSRRADPAGGAGAGGGGVQGGAGGAGGGEDDGAGGGVAADAVEMDCAPGDGRAPWNPYEERRALRGADGVRTDACDANGDLVSYQCAHDEYPCPRRDGERPHKHADAPCWRRTGGVVGTVVDCDGRCRDGVCPARCPKAGDKLTYLRIDARGDAVFDSDQDDRHIACTLHGVSRKGETFDCVAGHRPGDVFHVAGLGMSTTMCTGGVWGNISDSICTYRDCSYVDP